VLLCKSIQRLHNVSLPPLLPSTSYIYFQSCRFASKSLKVRASTFVVKPSPLPLTSPSTTPVLSRSIRRSVTMFEPFPSKSSFSLRRNAEHSNSLEATILLRKPRSLGLAKFSSYPMSFCRRLKSAVEFSTCGASTRWPRALASVTQKLTWTIDFQDVRARANLPYRQTCFFWYLSSQP
jgi:hypothetical protein